LRVVLLGHRISYSASPAMHRAAFKAAGLEGWTYELLDVAPEGLPAAIDSLRRDQNAGANVTIPHKVAVMELLDALEGEAVATGAVNTIRREGRRLVGSNTDVAGIRAALAKMGDDMRDRAVLVLGAGGAARAAAVALNGARLTFVARTPHRARGLPGDVIEWSDPRWHRLAASADLLVNATPIGRADDLPLPAAQLPARGGVIDLVYVEGGTPLIREAQARGLRAADGWTVLLAQGAAAFEAWTGRPAAVDAMREAVGR
jgi:shikimate dehydrogenase